MILNFEEYTISKNLVEEILALNNTSKIDKLIDEATKEIKKDRIRSFLIHTNSLFLNVLLNRLQEVGRKGEENTKRAREIIRTKI
ncbi:hypothetical protein ACHRV1_02525 [Flavobacterium aquidurense]|uniref:hypothetical protein n=1 Tax=Flavobacterium aquidurense TaxID=362413 RepID=UPI00375754E9